MNTVHDGKSTSGIETDGKSRMDVQRICLAREA